MKKRTVIAKLELNKLDSKMGKEKETFPFD